jgi:hypothetical protein
VSITSDRTEIGASTVITSLPIDVTRPLFGTTTKYNDIESQVQVDAGKYSEIRFETGSNTGIIPGDVLLELYIKYKDE